MQRRLCCSARGQYKAGGDAIRPFCCAGVGFSQRLEQFSGSENGVVVAPVVERCECMLESGVGIGG